MIKRWTMRLGLTLALGVTVLLSTTSPAFAGNTLLLLSDIDGRQVAHMVHVDDGDVFKIYDDQADGYGPEGCLQVYTPTHGWATLRCEHNGAGDGNPVSFNYNVLELVAYRMRLCHAIAGCSYQGFTE
ncbi:hypothetical protein [Glycomyces harbinensis]|uniref:Secreted protein n=1 Tax=Glycomyces harbinensis TaxID=58114 RepID=A0A1G6Z6X1_9ACTN|nr:hypothetical protein [Glycomyces harbinensis]SDD97717.1 hypothetical protein SAMN05216270_11059 [Glycomyces harbinensis]